MSDTSLVDDDDLAGGPDEEEIQDADGEDEGRDGEEPDGQEAGDGEEQGAQGHAQGDEGHVKPPSRSSLRIQKEIARRKEAEQKFATLEREIAEIRAAQQQPRIDPAEQARQLAEEQQRVSLMAPHEVAQYYAQKTQQQMEYRLQLMQLSLAEENDRAAFNALQTSDPLARKYADEVERLIKSEKAEGRSVKRETALNFVIGQAMRKRAGAAGTRQGKAAAARVAGASTKPGRMNGDAASDRTGRRGGDPSEAELERRLGSTVF